MRVEAVIDDSEGCHDVRGCGRLDRDGKDVVWVVGIGYEEELLTVKGACG